MVNDLLTPLLGIGIGLVIYVLALVVAGGRGFKGIHKLTWAFTDPYTRDWPEER